MCRPVNRADQWNQRSADVGSVLVYRNQYFDSASARFIRLLEPNYPGRAFHGPPYSPVLRLNVQLQGIVSLGSTPR